jgi:hypothetical protein
MKPCIMRKVAYRLPGTTRLAWAIVLAEREGLSLLFAKRPDEKWNHEIAIATENPAERVFEGVNTSRFPVEHEDLEGIGVKLNTLGGGLTEDEIDEFLKSEGFW